MYWVWGVDVCVNVLDGLVVDKKAKRHYTKLDVSV